MRVSAPTALTALLERLGDWRDRKLAEPKLRARLLANPLTRVYARRRAKAMLDLCAGFTYSQTLFACVQVKLFEHLRAGPQSVETLAPKLGLAPHAARRLLEAASALKLASRRRDGSYGLGDLGAALLGTPEALPLIEHQPVLYADLADPVALLRGETETRLSRYWPYSAADAPQALNAEAVAPYSALMAASNGLWSETALAAYDIGQHRRLLDVGGGEGAFLAAAAARAPDLRLMLFDLPAVAERARARLTAEGLSERAEIFSGDFLKDPLPQGADAISLVRIVHDHDDASALALLRNVRRALRENGTLLIVEAISDAKGAEALCAYYAFYTLAMGRGEPRRFAEIAALLTQAGFANVRLVETPLPTATSLIVAKAG